MEFFPRAWQEIDRVDSHLYNYFPRDTLKSYMWIFVGGQDSAKVEKMDLN